MKFAEHHSWFLAFNHNFPFGVSLDQIEPNPSRATNVF